MSLEAAAAVYARGDYAGALGLASAAAQGPDAGAALLILAKCSVGLGDFTGLGNVLGFAQKQGASPELTFFRIVHDCLLDGMTQPLIALSAAIPDGLLHPLALYHASCARLVLGDRYAALAGFNQFRLALPRFFHALPFGTNDEFNVMFRQGTLVLPPEETRARIAHGTALPPVQRDIQILKPLRAIGGAATIMCCADARYIAYFLPRWLAGMISTDTPIHVHVINPDPEALALVEEMTTQHDLVEKLSLSTSLDGTATATSYACARFEIVAYLLENLNGPLMTVDIDVAATPAFSSLLATPVTADFSCFETGRCEPASVHQASIMAFANTPRSLTFARDLAAYCRPKLHQPVRINWMLDQAALFSVLGLYDSEEPKFRYCALDRASGRPMSDYIIGLASDEEKHAIKVKSAGLDANADATGKTTFVWEP